LSEELNLVSGELKASVPFIDAMLNFNGRTQAFSVERTVTEIVNSREAGTPVAQVMNIAAKDLREARTNNAEQMGEKLKSKIILPSMMMAGSAMLLILGPAFIEILNSDVL
jgi:pilus assembly protein TadC